MKTIKKIFIANFIFLFLSLNNSLLCLNFQEKNFIKFNAECFMRSLSGDEFFSILMCNFFNQFSKETANNKDVVFRSWATNIICTNNIAINISIDPEDQKYMSNFYVDNLPENINIPELKIDNEVIIPALVLQPEDIKRIRDSQFSSRIYSSE
ncbi:MAG: hypothetical protein WC436_03255 [Candidatus Babeliales bacterium]